METTNIIRYGMVLGGVALILAGFWFHSLKKLTVNFAVAWEFLGLLLLLIGLVPALSAWTRLISTWTGLAFVCLGVVCLMGGFQFSLLLSQLMMKNQELAMQVSLLNQESERLLDMIEEFGVKNDDVRLAGGTEDEKDFVCN